jgi:hypothetical protein
MRATKEGFRVEFTQPLSGGASESILKSALALQSWTYRDAPDYGSPELDLRTEELLAAVVSADRRSVTLKLGSTEVPSVHPQQTPRVYHLKISAQTLFDEAAPAQMDAYYTLRKFAGG